MYLIETVPIAKSILSDKLTYFSKEPLTLGSIVSIPLRNKKVKGLVIDVHDAKNEKSAIKSAGFEIKKVESISSKEIFPKSFIKIIEELRNFYISSPGMILWNILPKIILDNSNTVPAYSKEQKVINHNKLTIIRASSDERYSNYRANIREQFAKMQSIYLCVPTIEDAENISKELSKGIEKYVYVLHSDINKKKIIETWQKIYEETHPVLIIATPLFLSVPRNDLGLFIIERENSRAYRMQSRPYIDTKRVIQFYAKEIGAKIIKADTIISTETWFEGQNNDFTSTEYRDERSEKNPRIDIINMSNYRLEEKTPFKTISDELHDLIKTTIQEKKKLFLFTPRKGLYPTTVCGDCGTVVSCEKCSAPVVIHKSLEGYIFVCHHCGTERVTEERCKKCDSWKLAALGVGIEKVFEDLKKDYPEANIFMLDKNSEPTRVKARKKIETFNETHGSILLGTEYSLLFIKEIDRSAAVSLDSLFLIPDFRMNERILTILSTIQSKTNSHFLIQTRMADNPLFNNLIKKTYKDFYTKELEERRLLKYPPFSFYIKISRKGKKENVEHDMEILQKELSDFEVDIYPGRIEKIKGLYIMHLLINLEPGEWPNEKLKNKISGLGHQWNIQVDPESLL